MARHPRKSRAAAPTGAPTRQEILDFVRASEATVGRREVARAFRVKGTDRAQLRSTLRELEEEGLIERGRGRRVTAAGVLPEVAVIDVTGIDSDGEVTGRPAAWREGEPPKVYLAPERPGTPRLEPGTKVLARLRRLGEGVYEARPMRVLTPAATRLLGVYELDEQGQGVVRPTEKRLRETYAVRPSDSGGAEPGDLVLIEAQPPRRRFVREARVVERIGRMDDAWVISLISIHTHELPHRFTAEAVAEAEAAQPPELGEREDLRSIPLVTIDGADARDFDDAVWAAEDDDPQNPGGWKIMVAIADVAQYVRAGGQLDREAYERGNSVYFPDRVVPMLPEALSNGLCSLRPNEDRACFAVRITLDEKGSIRNHRFSRGLMRSVARLTYDQVQAAEDGDPDDTTAPLRESVIAPLYGAFRALQRARRRRGTLDLDLAEQQVILDEANHVRAILPRARFDSHRLIEEFMIAANVAAAETLERTGYPCLYRVHDKPDAARVEALRTFLKELEITVSSGQLAQPKHFTQLLERVADTPFATMINELVLRSQAQAIYSEENRGHFGLGLKRYAHFTSPIRRYSDLLVHRSLIAALRLGEGALKADDGARFAEAGEHLSMTERRATAAERDALDRFVAGFLSDRVGEQLAGRIVGVTRFGLFVKLEDTGADGLVPISSLPDDYYDHDEKLHALRGRRRGRIYRLGDSVEVRLAAADRITGGIVLDLLGGRDDKAGARRGKPPPRPRRRSGRARN